ncbi:SRPBCC family protein [Nocardia amikacinitolerans]|uniref:SRPBCC family protein n=1 Tax=Nocardia amikacinitolerans TaxID=756689 RepID=UPI0014723B57|nr:SRPBCC family protein [Nocardia amikacinitolerans]
MVRLIITAAVGLAVLAAVAAAVTAIILRRRCRRLLADELAPLSGRAVDEMAERKPTFTMTTTARFAASPDRIWGGLEEGAFSWMPFIPGVRYPHAERGIGTVRKLDTVFFAADEQVLHHDPGRRLTVVGIRTSIPLFVQSYVADFRLEQSGGGTEVIWTVGGRPALFAFVPLSWTAPLIRPFARVVLQRLATRI